MSRRRWNSSDSPSPCYRAVEQASRLDCFTARLAPLEPRTLGVVVEPRVSIRGKVHRSRIFSVADLEAMSTDGETVRVETIIGRAVPVTGATHATIVSADGSYRASIPLEDLAEGGVLAFGSGRRHLSSVAGGPLRLTVVEGTTLCWNVKDVAVIDVTVGAAPDDVPARPTH